MESRKKQSEQGGQKEGLDMERAKEVVLEKDHMHYLPTTQCNMPEDQDCQVWDCQANYSWKGRAETTVIDALKGFKVF